MKASVTKILMIIIIRINSVTFHKLRTITEVPNDLNNNSNNNNNTDDNSI
jgi:hypothetical protein